MTVHTTDEAKNVASVLAKAAGRHFGGPATIKGLSRESGGASRQTWSFDAVVAGTPHELILRRDPPSLRETSGPDRPATSLDRATEFRVLAAAYKAGVRAPEVLFELGSQDGLGDGFVMRRVGGIAIARKLLRDAPYEGARKKIAGQLGEVLARIHATDPATLPPLVTRDAAGSARPSTSMPRRSAATLPAASRVTRGGSVAGSVAWMRARITPSWPAILPRAIA